MEALLGSIAAPGVEVRVLAFNDRVLSVCPWTRDFPGALNQIRGLQSGGNTALYQAIRQALVDLRGRSGRKWVLLFTDGRDGVGGADLEARLEQCRDDHITVSCLGLASDTLDRGILEQIAQTTGGTAVEVAIPRSWSTNFARHRGSFVPISTGW